MNYELKRPRHQRNDVILMTKWTGPLVDNITDRLTDTIMWLSITDTRHTAPSTTETGTGSWTDRSTWPEVVDALRHVEISPVKRQTVTFILSLYSQILLFILITTTAVIDPAHLRRGLWHFTQTFGTCTVSSSCHGAPDPITVTRLTCQIFTNSTTKFWCMGTIPLLCMISCSSQVVCLRTHRQQVVKVFSRKATSQSCHPSRRRMDSSDLQPI